MSEYLIPLVESNRETIQSVLDENPILKRQMYAIRTEIEDVVHQNDDDLYMARHWMINCIKVYNQETRESPDEEDEPKYTIHICVGSKYDFMNELWYDTHMNIDVFVDDKNNVSHFESHWDT